MDPDALVQELSVHLRRWLPRQRWFGADEPPRTAFPRRLEVLRRSWPLVLWAPVEVVHGDDRVETYQVLLGVARELPDGIDERAVLGEVPSPDGHAVVFDALAHPHTAAVVGQIVGPDLGLRHGVPLAGDFSNTSIVFDDQWIMKVFRRLDEGPNPDVEITEAIAPLVGDDVVGPAAVWRRGDTDLAVIRRFHRGVRDGVAVAAESLSELLTSRVPPRQTRADIARLASELGRTVARVHVALGEVFGVEPADGAELAAGMIHHLERAAPPALDVDHIAGVYRRLLAAEDLGKAIRVHGDLHLGQALRLRDRWLLVDFEGEPTRSIAERRAFSSPLRDVAGMVRSFHYAASMALAEHTVDPDPELALLVEAWEERATEAFIGGYTSIDLVHRLLPADRVSRDALLTVYELDKAVYEVAYELAHRPDLAHIPLRAVSRLLSDDGASRW